MELLNLKAEMKRKKVTQDDLADLLHMSTGNVNKKIAGKVSFTIDEARAVKSKYFPQLSIDYLFDTDVPDFTESPA